MTSHILQYLKEISHIEETGAATEHSYRVPLEKLLRNSTPPPPRQFK